MSMFKLSDVLGPVIEKYDADLTGLNRPQSAWDGPTLPENLEYRCEVTSAEFADSKAGNSMIKLTLDVLEPSEWAGRKLQQTVMLKHDQAWAVDRFAETLFAFGVAGLDTYGEDINRFTNDFVGAKVIIAVNVWGDNSDRSGVRWVNRDTGRALRANIAPPKGATNGSKLRPDIVITKQPEPLVSAAPSGVRLPPGLGR